MKLHSIATIATIAAFAVNLSGKVPVILCLMRVFVVVEPQISSNVAPLAQLTLRCCFSFYSFCVDASITRIIS
jgi:hypothetical protein